MSISTRLLALIALGIVATAPAYAARRKVMREKHGDSLQSLMARTAHGPSIDELRTRAIQLEAHGFYFSALRDRFKTLESGHARLEDWEAAGEAALALNRLEAAANAADKLRQSGPSSAWPVGFRAALAAYEFRQGRIARASELMPEARQLEALRLGAARAKALVVAAGIRTAQERIPEAINILGGVMNTESGMDSAFARLQRARLFYEIGHFSEALDELSNVRKSSPYWYDGMQVAAWSSYKLQDDNLTLGQTMSLNSPHLSSKFNPESFVLEAASLFRLCHYESAQRSLKRMRAKYEHFPETIAQFRREHGDRYTGVAAVLKYARGETGAPGTFKGEAWNRLVDGLLSQESFAEADRMLTQIKSEEDNIDAAVPAQQGGDQWMYRLRADYRGEFEQGKREAYNLALAAMKRRLGEMDQDVRRNLEGALAIDVEVNTKLRERLQTGAQARMKEVDFEAEVKKGYEFWPFEGEYWRDEVGGYAFATTDVCSGQAPGEL